jgi:hypothetical protein
LPDHRMQRFLGCTLSFAPAALDGGSLQSRPRPYFLWRNQQRRARLVMTLPSPSPLAAAGYVNDLHFAVLALLRASFQYAREIQLRTAEIHEGGEALGYVPTANMTKVSLTIFYIPLNSGGTHR